MNASRFIQTKTCKLAVALLIGSLGLSASAQHRTRSSDLATSLGASPRAVRSVGSYRADPVEPGATKSSTKPDVHGTLSVENFQGTQPNLSYTHESAAGFRNYLAQFYAPNYNYQDSGVGTWQFLDILAGQNYDKWTSGTVDYGIDAVLTSFHSSHGGMNFSTGVFGTSLGSNWGSTGWTAYSNKMALGGNANSFGDERLRYMFWDTCFSVKWDNGVSPMSTWGGARSKGVRMIFGYDTTSVDSPNYGKFFWEEWNKNKTFKTAFLDASWRINHGQSPCMVAFGSTQSEALNRRDTERYLTWGSVGNNWGAWAFYYAVKSGGGGGRGAEQPVAIPGALVPQVLVPRGNSDAEVLAAAQRLGLIGLDASLIETRPFALRSVHTDDLDLFVEDDGDVELAFTRVEAGTPPSGSVLADDVLIARGEQMAQAFDLAQGYTLQASEVRYMGSSSASESGEQGPEQVLEKTVVLDQVVAGLPFIDADAGRLEITFGATSGSVKRIRSTLKQLDATAAQTAQPLSTRSLAEARALAIDLATPAPEPAVAAVQHEIVPDSERVGFVMQAGQPLPVFRALLRDPRFPDSKLQEVTVPLTVAK